ncbi:hypothetical protein T439DRAFT_357599 [Meredithblackwellia eburnea MCA 4105]
MSSSDTQQSYQAHRNDHEYRYAPFQLRNYRKEPIFDSDSEPETEPGTPFCDKVRGWRPRAEPWRAPSHAVSEPGKKSFSEVLKENRDRILAKDRERALELDAERREYELKEKVNTAFPSWKEQYKRSIRIEDRWHYLRFQEEDQQRINTLVKLYPDDDPGQITSWYDYYHGNLERRWKRYQLGVMGQDNTVTPPPVIPSLSEILYPAQPDPHQSTAPKHFSGDASDYPNLAPPRERPIPFRETPNSHVGELTMQLDEVTRQLEQAQKYRHFYGNAEHERAIKRLETQRRRVAEMLGQEVLLARQKELEEEEERLRELEAAQELEEEEKEGNGSLKSDKALGAGEKQSVSGEVGEANPKLLSKAGSVHSQI